MEVLGFVRMFRTTPFHYIQRRGFSGVPDKGVLPVLIVGAGPVGLVLAILLSKLGVKCAILEKNKTFSKHPQAHFINNRSMEVFRKMDGLADEIQATQPPVDLWGKFIYCTSLYGSVLGSVDHMQPQDFKQVVSPVSVAHFSQYKLTALLLKQLENLSFHVLKWEGSESLNHGHLREKQILMGHECVSIDAADKFINVTASFLEEGKYIKRNIQCSTLVGADGAGSTVRKLAGISMKGEENLQKLVSIHFFSKELGQYLLNKRPGMLFFIFNTEAIGVLIAHDLKHGEFVLQTPFYPPQQSPRDFSPKVCENLIFQLVGQELVDIDVIDVKPWVMHAEVAEKFVSCDNRIILAGDAAHRFPPAGGFGMNTGIQDAHNLAWKLASVEKGMAPSSILHTYDAERRPVAIFNTELSIQNFRAAMAVPATVGLNPTIANSVHKIITDGIGSILPTGLQRAVLDGIFAVGRAQVSESLLNEKNPIGSFRLAKLRRIFEEGKSLQLQFPAEDLGFRYLEGALVPDNDSTHDALGPPTGRRRDYIPTGAPGSRLPHKNVKLLSNLSNEETCSTLDLVSGDEVEFLLIIAPVKDSYRLAHAALKLAKELKVSVKVCIMWPSNTNRGVAISSAGALMPWESYVDVVEVDDHSPSWWDMCKMTDKGAILVRPDEHIAWRVRAGIVGDPISEMQRVFSAVLGKQPSTTPLPLHIKVVNALADIQNTCI